MATSETRQFSLSRTVKNISAGIVASIAGIVSPLFFGAVYSFTLSEGSWLPFAGTAFLIAAVVLASAALMGWVVARRAERIESLDFADCDRAGAADLLSLAQQAE
jgi:hypothetical protein